MTVSPLLVGTGVVSFLAKGHPAAPQYYDLLDNCVLAISVVTVGEIEFGMELRAWGEVRRDQVRKVLGRFTVLRIEEAIARVWARVRVECQRRGRPIGFADAWIAATAIQMNILLVTHNVTDYEAVDDLVLITRP